MKINLNARDWEQIESFLDEYLAELDNNEHDYSEALNNLLEAIKET
jgi:hypothetical protein